MTNEELLAQMSDELLNNDDLLVSMVEAESPAALEKIFEENNIVLKDVSFEDAYKEFQKVKTGELDDEQLENVSGGVYFMLKCSLFTIAVSGSVGAALCVAGGVALIGLATYAGYKYINKKFG